MILGHSPLPVSPGSLEAILAAFTNSRKSVASLNAMVAAINHFHQRTGFEPPCSSPRLKLFLRGARRALSKAVVQTLPLTANIVRKCTALLGDDILRTKDFERPLVLWRTITAMSFSFAALARFNCMQKLSLSCLSFCDRGVTILFPSSKTDQMNKGQHGFVSRLHYSPFCPVLLLKAYTLRLQWEAYKSGSFPYDGPLFPTLSRKIHEGFAVSVPTERPFSRQGATKAFHSLLRDVGENPIAFSLHSGRRGGATAAAQNGCDFLSIKRQGRWAADSSAQKYIDDAALRAADFSQFLGL